jgi:HSP20 family protein
MGGFRMTDLTFWKNKEIDRLRRDMDLLFRRFGREFNVPRSLLESAEEFPMNLLETDKIVTISVQLSNLKSENIEISVTDEALTLKTQTQEDTVEKSETFERIAQKTRMISRTVSLPCRIVAEDVKATYQNGILEIVLPKCQPKQARGVKIELK